MEWEGCGETRRACAARGYAENMQYFSLVMNLSKQKSEINKKIKLTE
jgi:hypothetical protein